jgi:hypothetical protein
VPQLGTKIQTRKQQIIELHSGSSVYQKCIDMSLNWYIQEGKWPPIKEIGIIP